MLYDDICRKALEQGYAYEPCQVRKEAALNFIYLKFGSNDFSFDKS